MPKNFLSLHHAWEGGYHVPAGTDILVNATSVGLFPAVDTMPALHIDTLRREMVVADLIPNPPSTALLRAASEQGCRTLDGLGMLVNQGALAIELWTDVVPDISVMRQALEGSLAA
jgi:shikimate dehydrogenase